MPDGKGSTRSVARIDGFLDAECNNSDQLARSPRRRALCNIWTMLRQENRNFRCKRDETAAMGGDRQTRAGPVVARHFLRLTD
ncbi:hypothetical protein Bphy_1517 [Paraburkholderia phymatum STM815]|uniref:Uncharacterized protein n=1 Tax=Paraburkholderia phymatum (strain DSM 17167 / CIP 108236 / LMG 21445 / STM815) TaxID=391038 RepID=B2JJF6_PARP8|nr:hypothetical protein Bphy_1517 [Paraburkholderia phymatum STM815]